LRSGRHDDAVTGGLAAAQRTRMADVAGMTNGNEPVAVVDRPAGGTGTGEVATLPERRLLRDEVWLVLGLTFLASALWALFDIAARPSLAGTSSVLLDTGEGTTADLAARLLRNALAFVPVLLVVHLLHRAGETASHIGLSLRPPALLRRDVRHGVALAALVGSVGLILYLAAVGAGINRNVLVIDGAGTWWAAPMWLVSSLRFAVTEEVIVVGYLLRRLAQLNWAPNRALLASALLRGTYHLDQGLGGFAGNLAMGLLFGRIYQRTGRVVPLVVAHFLIDAVAGIGFLALRNRVGWLPS
jgi:membrane protease YdiL (CAAX protease family)